MSTNVLYNILLIRYHLWNIIDLVKYSVNDKGGLFMNKICKEYISDAKKFFPIMGRQERHFLRKISGDIEDLIEEENITSKTELIKKYRKPYEVANNYYCSYIDTDLIVKRIKISKYIKAIIIVFICTLLVALSAYISFGVQHQIQFSREEMIGKDNFSETISNDNDAVKSENFDELYQEKNE